MDKKQFKDQWNVLVPVIKQKWTKFSEQDINQINGDKTLFLNHLQKKYGIDRGVAESELEQLVRSGALSGAAGSQTRR